MEKYDYYPKMIAKSIAKKINKYEKRDLYKSNNLSGTKCGDLIVLYKTKSTLKSKQSMWVCLCKCHNPIIVTLTQLKLERVTHCGCKDVINKKDLSGYKFGRLVVVCYAYSKKGQKYWKCLCDCGNIKYVPTAKLLSGHTKSCGCIKAEQLTDLLGKRFGKLIVIRRVENLKNRARWECLCDCGETCFVTTHQLKVLHKQDCGCVYKKSNGEDKIKNILKTNNIIYETQKMFDDCRFLESNRRAMFDFYVDNSYIIEYDGNLHFIEGIKSGWNNMEHYLSTKSHDEFKNEYCRLKNIPLIRIPYTRYDELCLEDLLLETSKFRVI